MQLTCYIMFCTLTMQTWLKTILQTLQLVHFHVSCSIPRKNALILYNLDLTNPTVSCLTARKNARIPCNEDLTNPTVCCSIARKNTWILYNPDLTNPTVSCSIARKNAWIPTDMLTNLMFNCMDSHRHAYKPYVQLHVRMH